MAQPSQERVFRILETTWRRLSQPYQTRLVVTSCTALLISVYTWRRLAYKPELLPPTPTDYKYRANVSNDTSSVLTLADGRKIGYAEYGDPKGRPVITLHGIPGSRLENVLFDANAKELGIRIVGIERPGFGWSSPDPGPLKQRKVLDHAQDVEALACHLGFEEYGIIGSSGGGPPALACAYALPSCASKPRLRAVSIVTGLGLADMSQPYPAPLVWLAGNVDLRWLIRVIFTRSPEWQVHLSDEERLEGIRQKFDLKKAHPADVELAKRPDYPDMQRIFLCSMREAASNGRQPYLDECAILSKAPGFRVEDIRTDLPIQLWYGTDDTNVSPKAGDETAQRLRAAGNTKVELHMFDGETHGSTQVKYQRTVLEDLLRAMDS